MSEALVLSAGHQLRDQAHALAEATVACAFARSSRLRARHGPGGRVQWREDAVGFLGVLADALDAASPALFSDYVAWAKVMLEHRDVPAEDLALQLACMAEVVHERMPQPVADPAATMLEGTRAEVPAMPGQVDGFLDPAQPLFPLARDYLHLLLAGYRAGASRLVMEAADRGEAVRALYLQVFQPALWEIGRLWQTNKIYVAQEHFCSAATQMAMAQLLPRALPARRGGQSVMVVCVNGELHDLGARMVADFFDMAGWESYFCGADTPHADIVQTLAKRATGVLAISATMAQHVHTVQELIEQVRTDRRCFRVRILVGGHPFRVDPALWRTVGADGTAADAEGAVALARQWQASGAAHPAP
jgi:methanogenic corrinoid protein MtbC1